MAYVFHVKNTNNKMFYIEQYMKPQFHKDGIPSSDGQFYYTTFWLLEAFIKCIKASKS